MFKKKSWLKAPLAPDVAERYLSPVGQDVTPVKSFCAKGDGATGCIDYGVQSLCGSGASNFEVEFLLSSNYLSKALNSFIVSEYYSTTRGWGVYIPNNLDDRIRFIMGKADGSFLAEYQSDSGLTLSVGDTIKVTFEPDGSNGVIRFFQNGSAIGTAAPTQNKVYSTGAKLILLANQNGLSEFFGSSVCCVKVTVDGITVFNAPLQGSTYDLISGTAGTVNGTVDLFETQDDFHYNLRYGVSKWRDTGASTPYANSDYTWVPWVDGAPIVDTVAGHTLIYSCPPVEFKGDSPTRHNGCETVFRFPAGSAMDKADSEFIEIDTIPASEVVDTAFTINGTSEEIAESETITIYGKKSTDDWGDKVSLGTASVESDGTWETTTAEISSTDFAVSDTVNVRAEYGSTLSSEETMTVDGGAVLTALQITNDATASTKGDTYCHDTFILNDNIIVSGTTASSKISIGGTGYSTGVGTGTSVKKFVASIKKNHTLNWIKFYEWNSRGDLCGEHICTDGTDIFSFEMTSSGANVVKLTQAGTETKQAISTSSAKPFWVGYYNSKIYFGGYTTSTTAYIWDYDTSLGSENITTYSSFGYMKIGCVRDNYAYTSSVSYASVHRFDLDTMSKESDNFSSTGCGTQGLDISSTRLLVCTYAGSTANFAMRNKTDLTSSLYNEAYASSNSLYMGVCKFDGTKFYSFVTDGTSFKLYEINDADSYTGSVKSTITPNSSTAQFTRNAGLWVDDSTHYLVAGALKGNVESGFTAGDATKYDGFIQLIEK